MLTSLRIENIALLEKAELRVGPGLSALTGETGAGKSVVVAALSLALGGRADRDVIRHGATGAAVSATFDVSRLPAAYKKEFADLIADNRIVLRRTIAKEGVSRVTINGNRASLVQLRSLMAPIGEILGQHAGQALMDEDNHLTFLDRFAGLTDQVDVLKTVFENWRGVADELRRMQNMRERLIQERELLLFQKDEIEKAALRVGEEEELLAERKVLDSARELIVSASTIGEILDNETGSLPDMLSAASKELESMAIVDPALNERTEDLRDVQIRLEDLRRFIEQYGRSVRDDPVRIDQINTRLDEIYNLKKKYGGSEEGVLVSLQAIEAKLACRPDTDSTIARLEQEHQRLCNEYSTQALALSARRKKAAAELERLVIAELKDLAIDHCRFKLEFVYEDDPDGVVSGGRAVRASARGLEKARFVFSANPGEPLRPLVKTASGGEISRVLLALKSTERCHNKVAHSLLVFDEVDAGIGGRTAVEVGRKLKELSDGGQLIVVTHLHQIARQADHHFAAEKARGADSRNVITVRALSREEIKTELNRMVALPEGA